MRPLRTGCAEIVIVAEVTECGDSKLAERARRWGSWNTAGVENLEETYVVSWNRLCKFFVFTETGKRSAVSDREGPNEGLVEALVGKCVQRNGEGEKRSFDVFVCFITLKTFEGDQRLLEARADCVEEGGACSSGLFEGADYSGWVQKRVCDVSCCDSLCGPGR